MGLLDDAIRDHLDLKRRHGADPAEVAREEREALGRVRRGPDAAEEAALEPRPADTNELVYDHEEEPPPAEEMGSEQLEQGTPELVEETPEEDGMWFERRRPPPDGDLDG